MAWPHEDIRPDGWGKLKGGVGKNRNIGEEVRIVGLGKEKAMDSGALVGLMGLTFFCNKCVEVLYKFGNDGKSTDEFKKTCKKAISEFKALKWPGETGPPSIGERSLFNTNEEIESFERVLASDEPDAEKTLDSLISKLELLLMEQKPQAKRKHAAKELQGFFDKLADYSYYAGRDCMREAASIAGV